MKTEKARPKNTNNKNDVKLDPLDLTIIRLLNENGRLSSSEIARRIGGVSGRTVSNHIEALIENNVISIKAVINPEQIGYGVLADVFIDVEPGSVVEIANVIAAFPQVSYVACATGGTDISISVRVRTNEELFEFVTETLGKVPGVLRTQTHLLPWKIKDFDEWLPDMD
jgi:Lrp/AsnC family transcriptional regulator for asnA, asnC and gidA